MSIMRVLEYNDLDFRKIKKDYINVKSLLEENQFKLADLKKLKGTPYLRAKLNYADRLLLQQVKYREEKLLLAIEIIHNHEYGKSRFLRGASIQEDDVIIDNMSDDEMIHMKYIHPEYNSIHFLKKFISFDEQQLEIYSAYPPVVISGPAGSGKTIILLEKMKQLSGNGVYVTHSNFLVDHARQLYFSQSYENEGQEIDFFGLKQLIDSVQIPFGKEVDIGAFKKFTSLHSGSSELAYLSKDSQKLFEEFRGVISGSSVDVPYLSRKDYLSLGVKQTIYLEQDRNNVYTYFEKYLAYLKNEKLYDINLVAWEYLSKVTPIYDFVVVDEVQDLTPIQILLIFKFLKRPENFIFCGDGHQIVHPNFFSWAKLKSFLYSLQEQKIIKIQNQQILQVITRNFRNAKKITELSNKILVIKNLRFGSIDRESHFLLESNSESEGNVEFYNEQPKLCQDLNLKTKKSVRWAVIVMNDEQKAQAKLVFQTPLIFNIHEAKGLEYENVILYNLVSLYAREFKTIAEDIKEEQILQYTLGERNLDFSRHKDKEDKTLEAFKFFVNSVYVAITRAVESVVWIESSRKHPFLDLIQAKSRDADSIESLKEDQSSMEDWQQEASKLAAQGKLEQAEAIKNEILHFENVPWMVLDTDKYFEQQRIAFDDQKYDKKSKQRIYEFAHTYRLYSLFEKLVQAKHSRAKKPQDDVRYVHNLFNGRYDSYKLNDLKRDVKKYGPDFKDEMGRPVLMAAALANNFSGVKYLVEMGANVEATDIFSITTLQRLLASIKYQNEIKINFQDFVPIYDHLAQRPLKFKYQDRAIIVMPHKAEYFMINYFLGMFSYLYVQNLNYLSSQFLEVNLQSVPDAILPPWRKTRKYWNAILAKNHCLKDWSHGNLFLLRRIQTGIYILNPDLEINVDGEWVKIYEYLRINFLDIFVLKPNFMRQVFKQLHSPQRS